MNKVLLDTHALVWAATFSAHLSLAALKAMHDKTPVVSAASLWELIAKQGRSTALVADPVQWWRHHIVRNGVETLPIRVSHLETLGTLPYHHRDPADRILIAQAITERIPLISKDTRFPDYTPSGLTLIW